MVFAIGEITIRLLVPGESSSTIFHKLPGSPRLVGIIPNFEGDRKGAHVKINSRGFRDRDYPEEKGGNIFRIVGLGDSFTFGAGVELEDTYLKQLEKMLKKKSSSKQIEVLNMGVPAYNTFQELTLLKEDGLNYAPDLVIVGFLLNDVDLLNPKWLAKKDIKSPRQFNESVVRDFEPKIHNVYRFLKKKSLLLHFLLFRLSELAKKLNLPIETESTYYQNAYHEGNKGWQVAKSSLQEIAALGKIKNFQMLVVIFPFLVSLDDSYPYLGAHSEIVKFCKSQDIQVLDLFSYYRGRKPGTLWISLIDSHPNPEGHQIAAEAIYKEILKNKKLDFKN